VIACKNHMHATVPNCNIDAINALFKKEAAEELLSGKPCMVVDCIDNMDTKIDLILYCVENDLPCISSMGAGARADPSRICVGDVFHSESDPMAKDVRIRLKKAGVKKSVPVVYSTEKVATGYLKDLDEDQANNAHELAAFDNFRVRILPVCGTIPAMFGNALASHTLCHIAGHSLDTKTNASHKESTYQKILKATMDREKKTHGNAEYDFDLGQVRYIVDTVWGGKSGVSGMQRGITLVRWDPSRPMGASNVILLTKAEADQHEAGELAMEPDVRARIEHTLSSAESRLPEKTKSKRELKREKNKEIEARMAAKEAAETATALQQQ